MKIGSHVGLSAPDMYAGSVKEALSYGANAFMVYTGAPQNTIRKSIKDLNIEGAEALMKAAGLSFNDVVVHAPYIINLANPDPEKRAFAVEFLTKEVERTHKMHVTQIVLHPGSAVGKDRDEALKWIAEGVNQVIANTAGSNVRIALETMAGKGNEMGKTFEEIRDMIALIEDKSRISVCFDTCHTSDAGYPIKTDFEGVIKHFDDVVGKQYISVFHINDSKNPQGAAKDRHENIGFGEIGYDALMKVIYHEDFKDIPKILETPYVDNKAPYKYEIEMIKQQSFNPDLKSLVSNT
ncbi:MAG: deoxyribonuclease IV [Tenericutes bacterium HGW-Tenericutes-8]|nr:MAG: deoxyribonuclease IV [Tenericutes bacterium HGW-Tenericutes-8]